MSIKSHALLRLLRHTATYLLIAGGTPSVTAQSSGAPSQPFFIAPMVEWFGFCSAGATEKTADAAYNLCKKRKDHGVTELSLALDAMEPGGARGKVQVGYTVGFNLLTLQQDGPQIAFERMSAALAQIDRPAVIYLFANHFATTTMRKPLTADSMARFADQTIPSEKYFGGGVAAVTLDMSSELEVNRLRLDALKLIGKWFQQLPASSRAHVIGITLAGELHHFYDDFSGGMSRYDNIRVSDYSPRARLAFQSWLRSRYTSIEALNQVLGTRHVDFSTVMPPSKNIRTQKNTALSEHFDSYAHGVVPIEGWLEKLPAGNTIRVYLDGQAIGTAEYGLSRQDAYEVVDSIKQAQVGFRYLLDFSKLSIGSHHVKVVVEGPNGFLLAERDLLVMTGEKRPAVTSTSRMPSPPSAPKEMRFYVERPSNQITLFYNPLAKDWLLFREQQVTKAYDTWFDWAVQSGLPGDKLFSHQIAVKLFGGWNPVLFASDTSIQGKQRYKKGINLYGGTASMALLRRHYIKPGEPFAVPEFHTQAWKDPSVAQQVLSDLQQGGAVFVTPYFISMAPDKFRNPANDHDKFRVSPDNPAYGSDHFYRAIVNAAKH